jgi:membrane peptidoglycan carboxypeptidase
MTAVPRIIKSRQRRKRRYLRSITKRLSHIALVLGVLICLLVSLLIIGTTVFLVNLTQNLPNPENLPLLFEPPDGQLFQPTRIYDRSSEHLIAVLENYQATDRQYLYYDDNHPQLISLSLIKATIASADPGFWRHQGFSWDGIQQDTHPTLAQKIVADHLIWHETPSIQRALRERLLAAQITSLYGRHKILEWYLNSANYGRSAFGADAAARTYFGKSATNLSLAEAALLAAAAETPSLNPIDAPQAALQAKDRILQAMYDQELISSHQLQLSLYEALTIQPAQELAFDFSPAFTRLVLEQVSQYFPLDRILQGGLNLVTTMDYDLQRQASCTSQIQLSRMSKSKDNETRELEVENCEASRLLPSHQQEIVLPDSPLAANVVVLDPISGQVLALVSNNPVTSDPAHLTGHQPGSILAPFIYLTAFSKGMSPATLLWDIPDSLVEGLTDIHNPDGVYHGPIRARTALVNDYMVPTIKVLSQMGPDQIWQTAHQLGLDTLLIPPGDGPYLLPLQGGEATLLEISQAYGTFANKGVLAGISSKNSSSEEENPPVDPQVILKVVENSGREWLDCTDQISDCRTLQRPVTSPQLAYLVTNVLSDEIARRPSLGHPNPLEIGRPAGAKIGNTADQNDSWTVGYTPDLVVAVWLGIEDQNQVSFLSPDWAAGLWHALIQYATIDQPIEEWDVPPGISTLQVCDPSGLLPTEECPNLVDEVFMHGNEPTQLDNLYRTFLTNRETGNLATIFTPPALIDEEIYMLVPPEAEAWARDTGKLALPEDYDAIDIPQTQSSNARITSPTTFSNIRGKVPIIGRAFGEDFYSYRLQVGAGLNPSSWLQITDDVRKPVQNGQLGVWDTTGLDGLYVLQLLVKHTDDSIDFAIIPVAIDNQAPQVLIRYPEDGQQLVLQDPEEITIQADVSDNIEVASVEYYIDGELIATILSPPFVAPWATELGEHILLVRAIDQAGNMNEARALIEVRR